jgi:hypothetical protein
MGKGCVRFKKLDDLALDVVGCTVARVSVRGEEGETKVDVIQFSTKH